MKVTALKQQVKSSGRVSVFVEGSYSFSLNLDELVKYRLKNGDELEAADIKKFKKISTDGKLRARTLEWLLNRPHSEREVRDYLYKKQAAPDQIDDLVGEFTQKGYLDNMKFAKWFVELQGRRHKSDRQIRAGLFKKGISRELVDVVLESEDDDDEGKRLKALIEKKSKLNRYQKDPQKLTRYLVAQGFGWQEVKEALKSS